MKKLLVARFVALLMVGCGEGESPDTATSVNTSTSPISVDGQYSDEQIVRNKKGEVIDFICDYERMSDAGLKRLTGWTTLQKLDLRGTQTTFEGREELIKALPGNIDVMHDF